MELGTQRPDVAHLVIEREFDVPNVGRRNNVIRLEEMLFGKCHQLQTVLRPTSIQIRL
jgi:hypothetical protein